MELDHLRSEISQIKAEAEAEATHLRKLMEEAETVAELERFRAMERLWREHQRARLRNHAQVDLEREVLVSSCTLSLTSLLRRLTSQRKWRS